MYNLNVINEGAKRKKKKYTNSGVLNFKAVRYVPAHWVTFENSHWTDARP